jgi:hypothetical protein
MSHPPSRPSARLLQPSALASLALLAGGTCAGNLDPSFVPGGYVADGRDAGTGGKDGNTVCDAPALLASSCGACHSAGNILSAGLDLLDTEGLAARLVDQIPPGGPQSVCEGVTTPYLRKGSNPADGLLIDKLMNAKPECGEQMPYLSPQSWSADDMTCLRGWATSVTSGP